MKHEAHYSKGKFKMTRSGLDFEGNFSSWLQFCIGVAILLLSATPLIYVIKWW